MKSSFYAVACELVAFRRVLGVALSRSRVFVCAVVLRGFGVVSGRGAIIREQNELASALEEKLEIARKSGK